MFANETNLEAVKKKFNMFLNIPVKRDTDSPDADAVIHPVFDCAYQTYKDSSGDVQSINILQSPENLKKAKARKKKIIDTAEDVIFIGNFLKRGYRLKFLEYIEDNLSREDFSLYLSNFWRGAEDATAIAGVKKSKAKQWLSACDKDIFMDEERKQLFDGLKEEVTVYRAATDMTKNALKSALTWTLSYDDAVWYAKRYLIMGIDKSYVYQATIDKKYIYGCVYTETSDVVVDDQGLREITLLDTFTRGPET